MSDEVVEVLKVPSGDFQSLFGSGDRNVKAVERRYGVQVVCRDGALKVIGERGAVRKASKIIAEMDTLIRSGAQLDEHTLSSALDYIENGGAEGGIGLETVILNSRDRRIRPRSLGQCIYLAAMMENDLVFSIGPAGTGKTFLAVAVAVSALKRNEVSRIILCRPAVEAGENLGFLPGDLKDKVEPYFRPLYDALQDTLGIDRMMKLQEKGVIEVAPLAYMRGRTLSDAWIILDEAQNTTSRQMKMLLTRLGMNSKVVVTGDVTQIDLPKSEKSGLVEIESVLAGIRGVAFVRLTSHDVVRHRLVQDIIRAYHVHESANSGARRGTEHPMTAAAPGPDDEHVAGGDTEREPGENGAGDAEC